MELLGAHFNEVEVKPLVVALHQCDERNGKCSKLIHASATLLPCMTFSAAVDDKGKDVAVAVTVKPLAEFGLKSFGSKDVLQPLVKFRID
ncbi:hypothetical protein N185_17395 [Sinorhizobium sp. GW3]|nr:hypothetical protein N185_17395 [Sinorhizobium sp. GW3]